MAISDSARSARIAELLLTQMRGVGTWFNEYDPAAVPRIGSELLLGIAARLRARQEALAAALDASGRGRPLPIDQYLALPSTQAPARPQMTLADLSAELLSGAAALAPALGNVPRVVPVAGHAQPVRGLDLLRVELAYWAGYSAVLSALIPEADALPIPRPTLAESVRLITGVVAERFSGRAIELRVPPFAAVQLAVMEATDDRPSQGPSHTRGTPPNVVEMAPSTLLRLAVGHTTWADELAAGELTASGAHADLAHLWPLLG